MTDTDRLLKERQFSGILEEVKRLARQQGNTLTEDQVKEAFVALSLSGEQMQHIRAYLNAAHISIGSEAAPEISLTTEENEYLQAYLETIRAIPKLNEEEKAHVYEKAAAGDKAAQQVLIEFSLETVADIARLYADQGVFLEDLIGAGNEALTQGVTMLSAVESAKEREALLAKLSMDAMEALISETVRERARENKALSRVNEVAEKAKELAEDLRRKVTVEELAEETGWDETYIRDAIRFSGNQIEDIE